MPFVVLSLRPIFCSVDISLSSLILKIYWCSHLLQYSRLLLCCLTCPFQAVTYSLRKNSFNSHEVFLQVFVVTYLRLWKLKGVHEVFGFFVSSDGGTESCQSFAFCLPLSIQLAPMFEHLNELFTISSWIFCERKPRELTATPCPGKDTIVSCILISELQEACYLAAISLLTPCWERENTTKADATSFKHPTCWANPQQIEDIIHYVPKNELRAGHELRKTLSFQEQIMFKSKYTSVLLGQTGILCSLYLRHFLKCVQ